MMNREEKEEFIRRLADGKMRAVQTDPSPGLRCSFCTEPIDNIVWVLQDEDGKRIYNLHGRCYNRAIMLTYPAEGRS